MTIYRNSQNLTRLNFSVHFLCSTELKKKTSRDFVNYNQLLQFVLQNKTWNIWINKITVIKLNITTWYMYVLLLLIILTFAIKDRINRYEKQCLVAKCFWFINTDQTDPSTRRVVLISRWDKARTQWTVGKFIYLLTSRDPRFHAY